jgi:hypothetical protein
MSENRGRTFRELWKASKYWSAAIGAILAGLYFTMISLTPPPDRSELQSVGGQAQRVERRTVPRNSTEDVLVFVVDGKTQSAKFLDPKFVDRAKAVSFPIEANLLLRRREIYELKLGEQTIVSFEEARKLNRLEARTGGVLGPLLVLGALFMIGFLYRRHRFPPAAPAAPDIATADLS